MTSLTGNEKRSINYHELPASPDLAHVVLSYWEFTVAGDTHEPFTHEVFADGCVSLIYYRNAATTDSWLHVVGARLNSLRVEVRAGDCLRGVRLSPSACRLVLGCDPAALQNQLLPFSRIQPRAADGLFRQLSTVSSFAQTIAVYNTYLRSLELKPTDIDEKVAAAVSLIEANVGQIKIAELAAAVSLSMRQLERRFRAATGLTPKQFARVRRVRATAFRLVEEGETNWAAWSTEMGFADQSHLTREFVSVTGRSPVSFAEEVSRIEHGNLIK